MENLASVVITCGSGTTGRELHKGARLRAKNVMPNLTIGQLNYCITLNRLTVSK